MANYFHGVSTRQNDTSISTPVTADSGIAFVVGAAPWSYRGRRTERPYHVVSLYAESRRRFGV